MASSVLQLNRQKVSTFTTRSILSIIQNKLFNEQTTAFGVVANKSRNLCHSRSLCYLTPNQAISQTKQTNCHRKLLCGSDHIENASFWPTVHRNYSTNEEHGQSNKLPQLPTLMDFPNILWPSLLKTIKNWILVNFIIRPYFDQEFNMPNFVYGAKHALQVVSTALASGELNNLDGLVSADAIDELKKNLAVMSVSQRNEIAVIKDDIYFSFPYQVGVIFDESNESVQKRFVEITMVFHVLRGLKEMQDNGNPPPLNVGMLPEYQGKISICNYRFIKQFTQGCESDWTINVANHYKPIDLMNE